MGDFHSLRNTNSNVYSFLRTYGNNDVIVNIGTGNDISIKELAYDNLFLTIN